MLKTANGNTICENEECGTEFHPSEVDTDHCPECGEYVFVTRTPSSSPEAKELDIVKVTWTDSVSVQGWTGPEELRQMSVNKNMVSIGFLIKRDEECIIVSANRGEWNYGNSTIIPIECVTDVTVL